jgi:hypothetical protein
MNDVAAVVRFFIVETGRLRGERPAASAIGAMHGQVARELREGVSSEVVRTAIRCLVAAGDPPCTLRSHVAEVLRYG